MKVLFVDDEARILSGIENALIFSDDDWDVTFANSGEEAVEILGRDHYDVVVTDMKMPGLTGADVLEFAYKSSPSIVRLVLSGEVDPALAARAMPLAHEFISKPCDFDEVFRLISFHHGNATALDAIRLGSIGTGLENLPIQPHLYGRLQEAIAFDAEPSDLGGLVESDMAVTSAILKTANSAFYGFKSPVQDVAEAIRRLGRDTISALVLSFSLAAKVDKALIPYVTQLNEHAVGTVVRLRDMPGGELPEATSFGLLHDVGRLLLMTVFPAQYLERGAELMRCDAIALELELFKIGHAELGAYMLRMWNFDENAVAMIENHHVPDLYTGYGEELVQSMAELEERVPTGG
jgi:HD-like signal output (HDOD) protein